MRIEIVLILIIFDLAFLLILESLCKYEKKYYVRLYGFIYISGQLARIFTPTFGLNLNYIGKIIATIISFISVYYLVSEKKIISMGELHITKGNYDNSKILILGSIFYISLLLVLSNLTAQGARMEFDLSRFIYQGFLVGLDEELLFRSIGLGLLNKAFIKRKNILGNSLGAGFLAIVLHFALAHAVFTFIVTNNLIFAFSAFISTSIFSILSGLIALRTKSIVVPIILHGLYNGGLVVLGLM